MPMSIDRSKKVSIIIPTYNRAGFLIETIESVLMQWHDDYEILVIDDGSTDNTQDVLRPYIESAQISYRYLPNSGKPSVARNIGIKHAAGEYICFLDSDDVLVAGSIEKRTQLLDSCKDVALVFTDWLDISVGADGSHQQESSWVVSENFLKDIPEEFILSSSNDVTAFDTSIVTVIFTREFVFTSSVMVRKKVLDVIGGFDEIFTISEDRDLWLRVAGEHHCAYLHQPLVLKRRHESNITNKNMLFNFKQDRLAVEKFIRNSGVLKGRYANIVQKQLAEFYSRNGRYSWYTDDLAEARYCLTEAAKNYSGEVRTYLLLGCSFLPRTVISVIRTCKNHLKPIQAN